MRRGAAALLLLGLVTAACGRDPGEEYCAAVAEHQPALTEVAASTEPGALFEALPHYRELRAVAPGDLTDEWAQVIGRLETLEQALQDAGVDPASYHPKRTPARLTQTQRAAIEGAARDLGAPATVEAMSGIEQQALDVCKTPLSR